MNFLRSLYQSYRIISIKIKYGSFSIIFQLVTTSIMGVEGEIRHEYFKENNITKPQIKLSKMTKSRNLSNQIFRFSSEHTVVLLDILLFICRNHNNNSKKANR